MSQKSHNKTWLFFLYTNCIHLLNINYINMPRVLKPATDVYSVRVPKELKAKVRQLEPEESEALNNGVIKFLQSKTKHIK